jgi:hypothetical protein
MCDKLRVLRTYLDGVDQINGLVDWGSDDSPLPRGTHDGDARHGDGQAACGWYKQYRK